MNIKVIVSLVVVVFAMSSQANAADKPKLTKADKSLAGFPKLELEITTVIGHLGVFTPARVGDTIELDLPTLIKGTSKKIVILKFDSGDPKREYAIASLPGAPRVERINRYGNGAFQSARLIARGTGQLSRIDIMSYPGRGKGPNSVRVYFVNEYRGITRSILVLDGNAKGAFPKKAKPTK